MFQIFKINISIIYKSFKRFMFDDSIFYSEKVIRNNNCSIFYLHILMSHAFLFPMPCLNFFNNYNSYFTKNQKFRNYLSFSLLLFITSIYYIETVIFTIWMLEGPSLRLHHGISCFNFCNSGTPDRKFLKFYKKSVGSILIKLFSVEVVRIFFQP